jgi:hypothetical protein
MMFPIMFILVVGSVWVSAWSENLAMRARMPMPPLRVSQGGDMVHVDAASAAVDGVGR